MGLQEDLSNYLEPGNSVSTEDLLTTIRHDLKEFQEDLVAQLTQDIGQLQAEKVQLLSDIAELRQQKQTLRTQTDISLSQQQIAQQQLWAKQLAQALATRLYLLLSEKMQHPPEVARYDHRPIHTAASVNRYQMSSSGMSSKGVEHSLSSLNTAVNQTLASLRQDLDSHQSALNQQLNRMQGLEHQGEAILDALVNRLNHQLQLMSGPRPHPDLDAGLVGNVGALSPQLPALDNTALNPGATVGSLTQQASPTTYYGGTPGSSAIPSSSSIPQNVSSSTQGYAQTPSPPSLQSIATSDFSHQRSHQQQSLRQRITSIPTFQKGLILILLSTVALSLHNVVVQVIGNESSIFNIWRVGGYISLMSLDSSLMILWLRMIVVMPLMATIATFLYPSTWSDIKQFAISRDRRQLRNVISSGFFLFLSQVFIYIAIGQVGAGVAVTILFMYPIFTVPLAWWLFGDRPTPLRIFVMIGIFAGVVCTFLPRLVTTNQISLLGVGTAVVAGLAFACYLISMQLSFKKLHPVPVSVIQFFTIFSLASIILLMRPANVQPSNPLGLIIGGLILGTLTLMGYLFNNFGVRFMGAARASIIASSGPVLTALLAFLIIPGEKTRLASIQVFGILIVTAGVTALALERILLQNRIAQQRAQELQSATQENTSSQST